MFFTLTDALRGRKDFSSAQVHSGIYGRPRTRYGRSGLTLGDSHPILLWDTGATEVATLSVVHVSKLPDLGRPEYRVMKQKGGHTLAPFSCVSSLILGTP